MSTDSQNIDDAKGKSSKRKTVSYGQSSGSSAQKADSKVVSYADGAKSAASTRTASKRTKSSRGSGNRKASKEAEGPKSPKGHGQKSTTKRHATKEQVKEEKQSRHAKHNHDAKTEEKGLKGVLARVAGAITDLNLAMKILLLIVVLVVVVAGILYPIGCTYYQAMRQEQRYQAELDAVNARNDALQEENDALKTDEGVENQARKDLGWVKDGEQAVIISNSNDNSESEMPSQVDSDNIHAPRTWYYDILDVIFQSNV